jgi:hypothetical protein
MSKIRKNQIQEAKARFSELTNKLKNLKKPKNTLLDFFSKSPHPEVDLNCQRKGDVGRTLDL